MGYRTYHQSFSCNLVATIPPQILWEAWTISWEEKIARKVKSLGRAKDVNTKYIGSWVCSRKECQFASFIYHTCLTSVGNGVCYPSSIPP